MNKMALFSGYFNPKIEDFILCLEELGWKISAFGEITKCFSKNRIPFENVTTYAYEHLNIPYFDLIYLDLTSTTEIIHGDLNTLFSGIENKKIVICDPADCPDVIQWLSLNKKKELEVMRYLTTKAYAILANLLLSLGEHLSPRDITGYIEWHGVFPDISTVAS